MTTASESMPPAAYGKQLRHWRLQRGLRQADLGALLKPAVPHSTVSCWENGVRFPSRRYLGQLTGLTGIPASLVLGRPSGEQR